MSMHFERERGNPAPYSVIELWTDTRFAAQVIATRTGVAIHLAEGFTVAGHQYGAGDREPGREIHIEIREREP